MENASTENAGIDLQGWNMQVWKIQVQIFQNGQWPTVLSWISKHFWCGLIFWHFDATYRTVPHQFYQLFTIFVARQQYMFPVCFILMTRKIKDLYIVALNKVRELLHNFLPVHDFIRWLNSSNSDTTSDCVSLLVLFSPSY